jgi:hypothetical protein
VQIGSSVLELEVKNIQTDTRTHPQFQFCMWDTETTWNEGICNPQAALNAGKRFCKEYDFKVNVRNSMLVLLKKGLWLQKQESCSLNGVTVCWRVWIWNNYFKIWRKMKQIAEAGGDKMQDFIWSRILLEIIVAQLVKKFPALYGTRRFITVFTGACHRSLSWAT